MFWFHKCLLFYLWVRVSSTITGIKFSDNLQLINANKYPPSDNPCNPLYWYPRSIPEYCRATEKPKKVKIPQPPPVIPAPPPFVLPPPLPMPGLMPAPLPMPGLMPAPLPIPELMPAPLPVPALMPAPFLPPPPMSYGIPITNPMLSTNPVRPQAGFVPGLPGLVSDDGGINIMPFSDVYADILEKYKNRMIRRKLNRIIDDYHGYPNSKRYKRLRKYRNYFSD